MAPHPSLQYRALFVSGNYAHVSKEHPRASPLGNSEKRSDISSITASRRPHHLFRMNAMRKVEHLRLRDYSFPSVPFLHKPDSRPSVSSPGDNHLQACHRRSHGQDGPKEARRGSRRRSLSCSARFANGRRCRRDHVGERSTRLTDAAGGHALDLVPLGALAVGVQEVGAARYAGRRGVAGNLLLSDQLVGRL